MVGLKICFSNDLDALSFESFEVKYKDSIGYHWLPYTVDFGAGCDGDGCLNAYDKAKGVFVGTNNSLTNPGTYPIFKTSQIQFFYKIKSGYSSSYISEMVILSDTTAFPTNSPTKTPTKQPTPSLSFFICVF